MAVQPLIQRVAMTVGEGWGCLFTEVHLALKRWLRRKLSIQVLVGMQAMGSEHLSLALPAQGQLALRLLDPSTGQTKRHMVHGRPCPCAGQTRVLPGVVAAPGRGVDTSATWRLSLGKKPDWLWLPQRHMALGKRWAWTLPCPTPKQVRSGRVHAQPQVGKVFRSKIALFLL
jgi:hypothetical protein